MSYLTVSDGRPVGGVYGFMLLVFNIIKELKPEYLVICWDKSKTNIAARQKIYPAVQSQSFASAGRILRPDSYFI